MKAKLLKILRRRGRDKVHIHSYTTRDNRIVGMKYGYSDNLYADIFYLGDSVDDVKNRAARRYMTDYVARVKRGEDPEKADRVFRRKILAGIIFLSLAVWIFMHR